MTQKIVRSASILEYLARLFLFGKSTLPTMESFVLLSLDESAPVRLRHRRWSRQDNPADKTRSFDLVLRQRGVSRLTWQP